MKVISGLPPDNSGGTGRFLQSLLAQRGKVGEPIELHVPHHTFFDRAIGRLPGKLGRTLRRAVVDWRSKHLPEAWVRADRVLLLHPQTLWFEWTQAFLEARRSTWIFVLDCSFFCVRSYNYIPGEDGPCLRCLGGQWESARQMGCRPFPRRQPDNIAFLQRLKELVSAGKVHFLTQCQSQTDLVREHFGDCTVETVGLWADFQGLGSSDVEPLAEPYDIVYHGSAMPAKGVGWTLDLARRCPGLNFLFPLRRDRLSTEAGKPPPNAYFEPMRWETGLRRHVAHARMVLCPSLWSASIEGALVKTIALAKRVGVVDNRTAFSSEIPEEIIWKFPPSTDAAAELLRTALSEVANKDAESWFQEFEERNRHILPSILQAMG